MPVKGELVVAFMVVEVLVVASIVVADDEIVLVEITALLLVAISGLQVLLAISVLTLVIMIGAPSG